MIKTLNHTLAVALFLTAAGVAPAADVNLNGVLGNKALLIVDGGKPHWLATGETSPEGIKLISVSGDSAIVELGGKRQTLKMGQSERLTGGAASGSSGAQKVILTADGQGHFVTMGQINGVSVRMLVDTGASFVAIGGSEAKRLGIDITNGQRSLTSTANGVVPTYRVKLDEVRVGGVTLNNVDGMVHVGDNLPIVLLGMSFLNRMEMKRDGETMTLTKRY